MVEAPLLPISSTMIREMFVQNIKPTYLLPKDVISYIETEKLYKKNDQ